MKTAMKMTAAMVLILAAALTASAQGPRGRGPQGDSDRPSQPPQPEEIAADLLAVFDVDADGKLDEEELTEAIAALPRPPTPDEVAARWVDGFDADDNGSLSSDELALALEAHRPPHPPGGPRGDR